MSISTRALPSPEKQSPNGTLRPIALVTGASVGIGLELTKLLAADQHDLVLVARDEAKLQILATLLKRASGVESHVIPADLSQPDACARLLAQLAERKLTIDVLINNAGFGVQGRFWQADEQKQLNLLQVNIAALTHLTRLILPGMIERGRGRIMNLASIAGFLPGPYMACYFASKAYVLSFSVAINDECRGTGVTVTAVCPGPTRTEFFVRAGIDESSMSKYEMTGEDVARIGYRDMMRGKAISVTGWTNKALVNAARLFSRPMAARMVAKRNRNRSGK